jgi:opacity protein-like surface antigen
MNLARWMALAVGLIAVPALAQEGPAASPPPSSDKLEAGPGVHELLPDIGKIGSQVGILGGASWNPYEVGRGFAAGGFVDLPLSRAPGGKLSYEILLSLSSATSVPFVITDPVAYVANLASGADPASALAGPPLAPFPVRREVTSRLRVLEISPFALKWTITRLDDARLRPYVVAGLDFIVVITRQDPVRDESLIFTGTSPFDDALIGGLIAQAPELAARGYPTGQGNIDWGFHGSAGFEVRLSKTLSLNADYRYVGVGGTKHALHTASAALGFHW